MAASPNTSMRAAAKGGPRERFGRFAEPLVSRRIQSLVKEAPLTTAHLHAVLPAGHRVELYAEAPLPTRHGLLRALVFRETGTDKEHVVAVKGDLRGAEGVLARLHSGCLRSELLAWVKCDCREQLGHAGGLVGSSGRGAAVYLRQ